MPSSYRDDPAYIHDAGFGRLARDAAFVVFEELQRSGCRGGLVVDLGCGSGIRARLLEDAGHDVVGFDLSESLVRMARERVPEATFHIGSFATTDLPPCVAVTAIGEVFNDLFDESNSPTVRMHLFRQIHAALASGGFLLFDMAGPARAPRNGPQRTFAEGPDWAVLVEVDLDREKGQLIRRITSFRKLGELYRRDVETHPLPLVEPSEVEASLRQVGFDVQTCARYGSLALPRGLTGFLARKP